MTLAYASWHVCSVDLSALQDEMMFEMHDIDSGLALPPVIEEEDPLDTSQVPLIRQQPDADAGDVAVASSAGRGQPQDTPCDANHPRTDEHSSFFVRVDEDLREMREPGAHSPRQC